MYELLKKHHYCTACRKQDAYTLSGKILCFECAEKLNKQHREDYHRRKEYHLEKRTKTRKYRKENGLCRECGQKAVEGRTLCEKHLAIARNRNKKSYDKKREEKGLISRMVATELDYCWKCLKAPATKGKLCDECYEKAMRGLSSANKKIEQLKQEGKYNNSFENFKFGRMFVNAQRIHRA